MSRRIELELTSARDDGTWTWRAAGAQQPRGQLDGGILPSGSKVGDVLRAEADFDIEGITVLSVLPPKGARKEPELLEIKGPERGAFQPVMTTLATRGPGERRPRPDRPERGDRPPRDRDRDPARGPRPTRTDRPSRPEGAPRAERPDRPRTPRPERPAPPPPKPKAKKLRAGRAHRDALMATLAPEQVPVAEQLFRGGMPAVRAAVTEQNAKAKADGSPEIPETAILSIAEDLVARVRVADWLDRAEGAATDADEVSLRDLRVVVAGAADVARDESTRELAGRLKEVLDRRTAAEQREWLDDLTSSVTGGRVVRALRLASRPPEPNETLPPELATQLTEATNAAMTADTAPDRWATLLDAVAYSPIRRSIVPAGIPAEPGDELLAAVRKHAGRVPNVATLFGIEPPAPKGARAPRAPRPKPAPKRAAEVQAAAGLLPPGARRIPPPPAAPVPATDAAPTEAEVAAAPAPATDATPAATEAATAPVDAEVAPVEAAPAAVETASAPVDVDAEVAPVEAAPAPVAEPPALPAAEQHAALPAGEPVAESEPIALDAAPEPIAMPEHNEPAATAEETVSSAEE